MSTRVLVTGGAGFVGSHLCERLLRDGHEVISLDNYFAGSKENHIEGVVYREGHTKDIKTLVPEPLGIIYHLGEYARVAQSIGEPSLVWDLNMAGTFAVFEYARERMTKVVYAGSSTKFATARAEGIEGRDLSPYTWAKAANSDLIINYGAWYGLPYAIVYFNNVYGPRERAGKYGTVIEIFKQKRLAGEVLEVRSPGSQSRNYTHVFDIVDAVVRVGERGSGDGYDIGASKSYPILDVAKLFGGEIVMLPERKTSRPSAIVDTSKVRALGWTEQHSLEEYIDAIREEHTI